METEEKKEKISISTIVITTIAIIVIIVLVVLFYYFAENAGTPSNPQQVVRITKNIPVKEVEPPVVVPVVETTNIIAFKVPDVLPASTKQGRCLGSSVAEPFREDAFRCQVLSQIYDPCFSTSQKNVVFCQMNPLVDSSFLIKSTTALPKPSSPTEKLTNWAWFVKLKDGTICSPFTGAKLVVQGATAYYGCKSENKDEQVVLMGNLMEGSPWQAHKSVIIKQGQDWTVKSSEQVNIDTVWQ